MATGFLIGPRLLITNNHVLSSPAEATQTEAEFNYEHDIDGVMRRAVQYNLDPGQLFYTSTELDITLVAVAPMSDYGVPIERHGWLPLLPLSGKSVDGEWISIVQHPNGTAKQIAIHASQIIKLDPAKVPGVTENFIQYTTDTEPGSSGSPVLNDQWQVVAIHHKAIPAPPKRGGDGEIRWLANEGVRVSAIFNHLESKRFENENARAALDRLSRAMGFAPINVQVVQDGVTSAGSGEPATEQFAPFKTDHWRADGLGYDANFLSTEILLEPIYTGLAGDGLVAPLLYGLGHELKYWHFS
jgi:endonuclease G, mitochondrial